MFFKKKIKKEYLLEMDDMRIHVQRKAIKNIYLKVKKEDKSIHVSCPVSLNEVHLKQFINDRTEWIRKKIKKFEKLPPVVQLKFEDGENHYFRGEEYQLRIINREGKSKVEFKNDAEIWLFTPRNSEEAHKRKVLDNFYRNFLKKEIPRIVDHYEPQMGVKVNEIGVKKMKTKWGTCNIRAGRIWLSLELAKKKPELLELVVVHEMVHLLERYHNKNFYGLMEKFLPGAKILSKELNGVD